MSSVDDDDDEEEDDDDDVEVSRSDASGVARSDALDVSRSDTLAVIPSVKRYACRNSLSDSSNVLNSSPCYRKWTKPRPSPFMNEFREHTVPVFQVWLGLLLKEYIWVPGTNWIWLVVYHPTFYGWWDALGYAHAHMRMYTLIIDFPAASPLLLFSSSTASSRDQWALPDLNRER